MSVDLNNKVMLITGAARGLGFAYAHCLARHGASVVMHDGGVDKDGLTPDPDIVLEAAQKIGSENILAIDGLLNNRDQCAGIVDTVIDKFGHIDGLISNAGIVTWQNTADVDSETFRTSSAVNHEASFWLCQAALPHMQSAEFGRIILTSSTWALKPYPGAENLTLYAQSKGAQFGVGMALANATGHHDIKVNVIAPVAKTRIYASEVEPGSLEPEMVAGTVAWLVSGSCTVNGKVLRVADGNITLFEMSELASSFLGRQATDPAACGDAIEKLADRS